MAPQGIIRKSVLCAQVRVFCSARVRYARPSIQPLRSFLPCLLGWVGPWQCKKSPPLVALRLLSARLAPLCPLKRWSLIGMSVEMGAKCRPRSLPLLCTPVGRGVRPLSPSKACCLCPLIHQNGKGAKPSRPGFPRSGVGSAIKA